MNWKPNIHEKDHETGNENCPQCWLGYPVKCKCGGLIHGEFEDEIWDEKLDDIEILVEHKCDKCGDNWEENYDEI